MAFIVFVWLPFAVYLISDALCMSARKVLIFCGKAQSNTEVRVVAVIAGTHPQVFGGGWFPF